MGRVLGQIRGWQRGRARTGPCFWPSTRLVHVEPQRHHGDAQTALRASYAAGGGHMQCLDGKLRAEDKLGVCWPWEPHSGLPSTLSFRHTPSGGSGKETAHTQARSYHVGVCAAWQPLTRVQMKELVDLGGGQAVSDLQLLDNEDLA